MAALVDPKEDDMNMNIEDMVLMPNFTPDLALANIRNRFSGEGGEKEGKYAIYTWVSSILISVNPYKDLGLYADEYFDKYRHDAIVADRAPHIFSVARTAYRQLIYPVEESPRNQSILISGESGAGKTEATKLLLRYFAEQVKSHDGDQVPEGGKTGIELKLLYANAVLEAFGNAKTLRNDNSSRFGKWIDIYFNQKGQVLRGTITKYLLEGTRVIIQDEGERNFNVFYQLCAAESRKIGRFFRGKSVAIDIQKQREVFLKNLHTSGESTLDAKSRGRGVSFQDPVSYADPEEFDYLNRSGCFKIRGRDESEMYKQTVDAFIQLGFQKKRITEIFNVLKAILCLGNIDFEEGPVLKGRKSCLVTSEAQQYVKGFSMVTGLASETISHILTVKDMTMPGGTFFSLPRPKDDAEDTRDALAKTIYHKLFDWLLKTMNELFKDDDQKSMEAKQKRGRSTKNPHGNKSGSSSSDLSSLRCIGILDIFGFEAFEHNSFEQLCINFANESLQQHFVKCVFRMELELYKEEGIDIKNIPYPDNSATVSLLSSKGGIFSLLKEQIGLKNGSDEAFADRVQNEHRKHKSFRVPPSLPDPHFTVKHYAEDVTYNSTGFLIKNRSKLSEDIGDVIATCDNPVLKMLFSPEEKVDTVKALRSSTPKSSGRKKSNTMKLAQKAKRSTRVKRGGRSKSSKGVGKIGASSIAAQFQKQLSKLIKAIEATDAHFVRCVKPNKTKAAIPSFEDDEVLRQLVTCGIIHAVKIRKLGYARRMDHKQFVKRYAQVLVPKGLLLSKDAPKKKSRATGDTESLVRQICLLGETALTKSPEYKTIMKHRETESKNSNPIPWWQLGKRLVFYKPEIETTLEDLRRTALGLCAVKIQSLVRGFITRCRFAALRKAYKDLNLTMNGPAPTTLETLKARVVACVAAGVAERLLTDARKRTKAMEAGMAGLKRALSTSRGSIAARLDLLQASVDSAAKVFGYEPAELTSVRFAHNLLEGLARDVKEHASKIYLEKKFGSELVSIINEYESKARSKAEEGLVMNLKGKSEVKEVLATIERLDEIEKSLTSACTSRDLPRICEGLKAAQDIGGKKCERPVIKEAEGIRDSIETENLAESAIKTRKVTEVKRGLDEVSKILEARPDLAEQKGARINAILSEMKSIMEAGKKIDSHMKMLEHYLGKSAGKSEADEETMDELQVGIKETKALLSSVKSLQLEESKLLATKLAETESCLDTLEKSAAAREIRLRRQREEEERKRKEQEEQQRREEEERRRREEEERRQAEAAALKAQLEKMRQDALQKQEEERIQREKEEQRRRDEAEKRANEEEQRRAAEAARMQAEIERLKQEKERQRLQEQLEQQDKKSDELASLKAELEKIKREAQEKESKLQQELAVERARLAELNKSKPEGGNQGQSLEIIADKMKQMMEENMAKLEKKMIENLNKQRNPLIDIQDEASVTTVGSNNGNNATGNNARRRKLMNGWSVSNASINSPRNKNQSETSTMESFGDWLFSRNVSRRNSSTNA